MGTLDRVDAVDLHEAEPVDEGQKVGPLRRARRLVVLDIPLLFEKGGTRLVDIVAVVSAPAWMQRRRVLARPGMSQARLDHILALQTPDPEKRRRADHLIQTGTTFAETRAQVRRLVACLGRKTGR